MELSKVMETLNNVPINAKDPANVNYARCRYAIEEAMPNRETKRGAKMKVVEFLGGKIEHATKGRVTRTVVVFSDNTTAKF